MRTIETKIFKFDELSPTAKERAKQDYRADGDFPHGEEYIESLEKLAEHFGGKMTDYSIDWGNATYATSEFEMPDSEDIGNNNLPDHIQRGIGTSDATEADVKAAYEAWLKKKIDELGTFNPKTLKGHGDCVLTGCGTDEDAIDGLRKAYVGGERDLEELMKAAFESAMEDADSECEAFYEDENFSEHADGNDMEFYENGKLYRGKKA
jgi:hypothetical protein